MANKVLQIGDQTPIITSYSGEVYRDVSMLSKYNCKVIKPDVNDYYTLTSGWTWDEIEKSLKKKVEYFTQQDFNYLIENEIISQKEGKLGYVSEMKHYHRSHDNPYVIDTLVNMRNVYHDNKLVSAKQQQKKVQFSGAVQNALKNIFTWVPGERIINPEFGSNIRKLLYEQITSVTEERIASEIKRSVSRWEPRAQILEIINMSNVEDTEDNTIRLDIKYRIEGIDDIYVYTYEQINTK